MLTMYDDLLKLVDSSLNDKKNILNHVVSLINKFDSEDLKDYSLELKNIINANKSSILSSEYLDVSFSNYRLNNDSYVKSQCDKFINIINNAELLKSNNLTKGSTLLITGSLGTGKKNIVSYISTMTNLPILTINIKLLLDKADVYNKLNEIFNYAKTSKSILYIKNLELIRNNKFLSYYLEECIKKVDLDTVLIASSSEEVENNQILSNFDNIIKTSLPEVDDISKTILELLMKYNIKHHEIDKKLDIISSKMCNLNNIEIKKIINQLIITLITNEKDTVYLSDILKELYLYSNQEEINEDKMIKYLLDSGVVHKELNENLKIPLRKIQSLSKK